MKLGTGLFLAVIAEDLRPNQSILGRHLLAFQEDINTREILLHVAKRFPANGALVRVAHVLAMANKMYAVSTGHEHYRTGGGKKILATDHTVTL